MAGYGMTIKAGPPQRTMVLVMMMTMLVMMVLVVMVGTRFPNSIYKNSRSSASAAATGLSLIHI